MSSRAFITQEQPALNYNKVEAYGTPVFITRHDYMSVDGTEHNTDLTNKIHESLRDFDPDNDYIVPSGSPLVTAVAIAALAARFDKIRILRWSNRDYTYYPFTLEV